MIKVYPDPNLEPAPFEQLALCRTSDCFRIVMVLS